MNLVLVHKRNIILAQHKIHAITMKCIQHPWANDFNLKYPSTVALKFLIHKNRR